LEIYNPGDEVRKEIREVIYNALRKMRIEEGCKIEVVRSLKSFGDLSVNVARIAGTLGEKPEEFAEKLRNEIVSVVDSTTYLEEVNNIGVYLNFKVKLNNYGDLIYRVYNKLRDKYGYIPSDKPEKIIVEHTSANPIHPLHIGHLRNTLLGDALLRILKNRGHEVKAHFYIDDTGLQVAYAAYGYSKVKDIKRDYVKPDHFIGLIYSITNTIVNIVDLKKRIKEMKNEDKLAELNSKLSEWMWISKELREKDPELFDALAERIRRDDNPLVKIREINRAYEEGEIWAVKLVREMVNKCLEGFKQTFERLGVRFDSWDWESELTVWNEAVNKVIRDLTDTELVYEKEGALVFAADRLARYEDLRKKLDIPPRYEVQPLVLVRSDGTSLYTTRDIAYSVWKLQRADRVINVIAIQQTLAQAQIRLALYALGLGNKAGKMIHYSYEIVKIPGGSMSGRKGRYISVDELLDEAIRRSMDELRKRGHQENIKKIAEKIGIGAIKFFFLNYSPNKILTFDWNKVLNFNQNSGPFVQYSYVRTVSILRKAKEQRLEPVFNPKYLGEEERALLVKIGDFPQVMAQAADRLRPDLITGFLNELAIEFNNYYDHVPILKASEEKRGTRLALILVISQTFLNGMRSLGIEPPTKM